MSVNVPTLNALAQGLPEARRGLLRKVLFNRAARTVFFELVGDQVEMETGHRPRGLLEILQYIVENFDKIEPIILFIMTLFGL